MKKIFIILLGALLCVTAVLADSDRVKVEMHQLPDAARTFVKHYFGDLQVASAAVEQGVSPSYEVMLIDGTTLDFDSRGEWYDIERPQGVVPSELIPVPISKFIATNYPDRRVTAIERDGKNHEVRLDNGLELKFNRKYRLIGADD